MQKIIHFIKYHNAFSIMVFVVFIAFNVGLAASPEFRENFVNRQETVQSVDNSALVLANLSAFNFQPKIKSISEDDNNFYVVYSYKTLIIDNYVWQEKEKENTLVVNKRGLEGRDLGLYVAEELSEMINYEISYLKRVQQMEKEKGITQKKITIQYSGLIGKMLSPKEQVFPGYQPLIKENSLSQRTSEVSPKLSFPIDTNKQQTASVLLAPNQSSDAAGVGKELLSDPIFVSGENSFTIVSKQKDIAQKWRLVVTLDGGDSVQLKFNNDPTLDEIKNEVNKVVAARQNNTKLTENKDREDSFVIDKEIIRQMVLEILSGSGNQTGSDQNLSLTEGSNMSVSSSTSASSDNSSSTPKLSNEPSPEPSPEPTPQPNPEPNPQPSPEPSPESSLQPSPEQSPEPTP
jgi:hypothetical protein